MPKSTPHYWPDAKDFLSGKDKTLGKLISSFGDEALSSSGNSFSTLTSPIVGQQISVKAAEAIWNRLKDKLGKIEPKNMLKLSEEDLRSIGLSRQKVSYVYSLSEFFLANKAVEKSWAEKHDEEIIKDLVSIKGIGRWTAEMFLIFHLMRPDVFPIGDLGLLKAVHRHYNKEREMEKPKVLKLAQKWQPYRTVATWYLWRSLDPMPVKY